MAIFSSISIKNIYNGCCSKHAYLEGSVIEIIGVYMQESHIRIELKKEKLRGSPLYNICKKNASNFYSCYIEYPKYFISS